MTKDHFHNASFDYARLAAVLGIIWFHSHAPGGRIGYAGLAFFLLLMVMLALPQITATRSQPHRAPAVLRYAAARGRRLLVPWLIASVFYGGLKLVEVSQGSSFGAEFTLSMWLTGPALHLWFLPFAFAVSLALWPLGRALRHLPARRVAPLAGVLTVAALAALALAQDGPTPVPLAQWTYALPVVLLGTALTLLRHRPAAMLGLTAFFACCALGANWTRGLLEITLASGVLILCTALPLRATALSTRAARGTLALYLIHPGVMALVTRAGLAAEGTTALAVTVTLICCGIIALWDGLAAPRLPALS